MNAHSLPRITGKSTDGMARVLDLMSDGRERTANDVAVRLKISRTDARLYLGMLARRHKIKGSQWQCGPDHETIWKIKE